MVCLSNYLLNINILNMFSLLVNSTFSVWTGTFSCLSLDTCDAVSNENKVHHREVCFSVSHLLVFTCLIEVQRSTDGYSAVRVSCLNCFYGLYVKPTKSHSALGCRQTEKLHLTHNERQNFWKCN